MRLLKSFITSVRGSAVEKFAFGAVLLVSASVASANFLTKFAAIPQNISVAKVESLTDQRYVDLGSLGPAAKAKPKFNNVDETPTASLPLTSAQKVVLDPCTGKSK